MNQQLIAFGVELGGAVRRGAGKSQKNLALLKPVAAAAKYIFYAVFFKPR
jgi:hypothetical protein